VSEKGGGRYEVVVKKAAVFSNYPSLKKKLKAIPAGSDVNVNLRDCVFVDHTVMERRHQFELDYKAAGGHFQVTGLERHRPNSRHPLAAQKVLKRLPRAQNSHE